MISSTSVNVNSQSASYESNVNQTAYIQHVDEATLDVVSSEIILPSNIDKYNEMPLWERPVDRLSPAQFQALRLKQTKELHSHKYYQYLSKKYKDLLNKLLYFSNEFGFSVAGQERLTSELDISKSTLRRRIKYVTAIGMLAVHQNGKNKVNTYEILAIQHLNSNGPVNLTDNINKDLDLNLKELDPPKPPRAEAVFLIKEIKKKTPSGAARVKTYDSKLLLCQTPALFPLAYGFVASKRLNRFTSEQIEKICKHYDDYAKTRNVYSPLAYLHKLIERYTTKSGDFENKKLTNNSSVAYKPFEVAEMTKEEEEKSNLAGLIELAKMRRNLTN